MSITEHNLHSSYREMLLEHLFSAEVMRYLWLTGTRRLEVLKPQVDDGGYDLVLEANAVVRHVQLKATFKGSKVKRFDINMGLAAKPSGCVVGLIFAPTSLTLGPFLWFGAPPGQRLPDLRPFRVAKHTKANALGIKTSRPQIRVLPLSVFEIVETIPALVEKLFGPQSTRNIDS